MSDLIGAGDTLQSAGNRVAEWVEEAKPSMPYEVELAVLEIEDAVKDWTEARVALTRTRPLANVPAVCDECGIAGGNHRGTCSRSANQEEER